VHLYLNNGLHLAGYTLTIGGDSYFF